MGVGPRRGRGGTWPAPRSRWRRGARPAWRSTGSRRAPRRTGGCRVRAGRRRRPSRPFSRGREHPEPCSTSTAGAPSASWCPGGAPAPSPTWTSRTSGCGSATVRHSVRCRRRRPTARPSATADSAPRRTATGCSPCARRTLPAEDGGRRSGRNPGPEHRGAVDGFLIGARRIDPGGEARLLRRAQRGCGGRAARRRRLGASRHAVGRFVAPRGAPRPGVSRQ